MDKQESPLVLFASCAQLQPESLIQDIFGHKELPGSHALVEDIWGYPWKIDTRYYTAEVLLAAAYSKTIGDEAFAEKVEALILHFDTTKSESFESVKQWLPFVTELDPEIRILLCNTCSDGDAVSRMVAWQWCLDNSFELVELQPADSDTNSQDLEDDFEEAVGIERVIQALHNHTWSNLVMKDQPSFRSQYMQDIMEEHANEQASLANIKTQQSTPSNQSDAHAFNGKDQKRTNKECAASTSNISKDNATDINVANSTSISESQACSSTASARSCEKESKNSKDTAVHKDKDIVLDSLMDEDRLNMLGEHKEDEDGTESFEKLFENFRLMKEKAEALPLEQRKKYAEQVAIQFWKAMGGDEDEIEGLDSDLDEEDVG